MKRKKLWYFIIIALLMVIICIAVNKIQEKQQKQTVDTSELEYSLVYDEEYYLEHNPDVAKQAGNDSQKLFDHFLNHGMDEARSASANFDVHYYRDTNEDLNQAFGDDWKKYYIHYMQFGVQEERKGSLNPVKEYECALQVDIIDETTVKLDVEVSNEKWIGKEYYILQTEAYDKFSKQSNAVMQGKLESCTSEKIRINELEDHLNDKFVVAIRQEGKFVEISNIAYLRNAEILSDGSTDRMVPKSKKGLQIASGMVSDAEQLHVSYPFTNLVIQKIMTAAPIEGSTITFVYKGKEYYFVQAALEEYDDIIKNFTEEGSVVTTSIVSIKSEGLEALYYPGIDMDKETAYYAVNTSTKEGAEYLEAFVTFISQRYNGRNGYGLISNYVVGNEVNESGTYNYMGEKELDDYLEEYTRTFRIVYNIVKSNNNNANIYVPMEPWWGIGSDMLTYGGKDFLTHFNLMMSTEGKIDWGLAYHAYSFPLSDPKVLNDNVRTIDSDGNLTLEGYVTTDNDDSVTITMENIEVLVEFMKQKEFLDSEGQVRSIILSEQGYTSNSNVYGLCEAQQAASMLYAYYKTEMIDEIDAFIYFLQSDNAEASLGNDYYLFGLWGIDTNGSRYQKLSYSVYKDMDTRYSLQEFSYIKDVLGIEEWSDVIDNFEESIFEHFDERANKKKLLDISQATIDFISDQQYTGKECMPNVCVRFNGKILQNDIDYDVVYLNNVDSGEATAVVVGLRAYCGTTNAKFRIEDGQ